MNERTSQEIHRIEEEVLFVDRVLHLIDRARTKESPQPSSRILRTVNCIARMLNSSFALMLMGTIIGGSLMALLSNRLERSGEFKLSSLTRQRQLFDARHNLISDISENFSNASRSMQLRVQLEIDRELTRRNLSDLERQLADGGLAEPERVKVTSAISDIKTYHLSQVDERINNLDENKGESLKLAILLSRARAMFHRDNEGERIVTAIDAFENDWKVAVNYPYLRNVHTENSIDFQELDKNVGAALESFEEMVYKMTDRLVAQDAELID